MPSLPLLDYIEIRKTLARGPARTAPRRLRDAAALIILAAGADTKTVVDFAKDVGDSEGSFGAFTTWERLVLTPFLMSSPVVTGHIGTHLSAFRAQWASFSLRHTSPWLELSIAALLAGSQRADDSYLLSRIGAAWKDLKIGHFWRTGPEIMPDLALLAAFRPEALIDLDLAAGELDEAGLPGEGRLEAAIVATIEPVSMTEHGKVIAAHREQLKSWQLEHAADALPILSYAALRTEDSEGFAEDVHTAYDALRLAERTPAMAQRIALGLALLVRSDPAETRIAALLLAKSLIEAWRQQIAAETQVLINAR